MVCKKCGDNYEIKIIPKIWVDRNPEKYEYCVFCRKYKYCANCKKEFHHHQNQTCSAKCAKEMKENTLMNSNGAKHNFCKNSKSRMQWEKNLIESEGISNVFQREDVKQKIKQKNLEKYGVDNPSKCDEIKLKKKITLDKTVNENPNLFKENWKKTHLKFLSDLGYDPRLHLVGRASKESMKVFEPLLDWCISLGIEKDDIYIGFDDRKEFFISAGKNTYFYDFVIRSKKIIIEYHGIAFHANPKDPYVKEWRNPFTNEDWKTNLRKTKIKNNKAIKRGFNILEIWSDNSVVENIKLCKKFILENYENKINP